jgi:hypothetical protein
MKSEDSPRVQLAEAIATVREFVVHASALARMGIKPPLPHELESLAREIIAMMNRTPQDAERSTVVSRDGVSTEHRSDTTTASAATTGSQNLSVSEPTVRRKTLRGAILHVLKEGEVVSVHEVVQRLREEGFPANLNIASASNELSRWVKLGVLDRPRRGHYRRAQAPREEEVRPPTAHHTQTARWEDANFDLGKDDTYDRSIPAKGPGT